MRTRPWGGRQGTGGSRCAHQEHDVREGREGTREELKRRGTTAVAASWAAVCRAEGCNSLQDTA